MNKQFTAYAVILLLNIQNPLQAVYEDYCTSESKFTGIKRAEKNTTKTDIAGPAFSSSIEDQSLNKENPSLSCIEEEVHTSDAQNAEKIDSQPEDWTEYDKYCQQKEPNANKTITEDPNPYQAYYEKYIEKQSTEKCVNTQPKSLTELVWDHKIKVGLVIGGALGLIYATSTKK